MPKRETWTSEDQYFCRSSRKLGEVMSWKPEESTHDTFFDETETKLLVSTFSSESWIYEGFPWIYKEINWNSS